MSIKDLVLRVHRAHPETLTNYNLTVVMAWKASGAPIPDDLIECCRRLPNVETLRRQSARLRNVEGRFGDARMTPRSRTGQTAEIGGDDDLSA